jgi:general secretion pathway protein G
MKRKLQRRRQRLVRSAFTLMEVMLVLVIIAAIASLVITNLSGFQGKADQRVAQSKINILKNAVESYKMEMRSFPPDLESLHTKPSNVANVNNWYQILKEPPGTDPWGNAFQYSVNGDAFEIRSLGPDGTQSDDDIL